MKKIKGRLISVICFALTIIFCGCSNDFFSMSLSDDKQNNEAVTSKTYYYNTSAFTGTRTKSYASSLYYTANKTFILGDFIIEEADAPCINDGKFVITAPYGFYFADPSSFSLALTDEIADDGDFSYSIKYRDKGNTILANSLTVTISGIEKRTEDAKKGSLTIKGLSLYALDKAYFGDVCLTLSNDDENNIIVDNQVVTVAKYFDLTLSAQIEDSVVKIDRPAVTDEKPADKKNDAEYKTAIVTMKQEINDSWAVDKQTEIKVPIGITIKKFEILQTRGVVPALEGEYKMGDTVKDYLCVNENSVVLSGLSKDMQIKNIYIEFVLTVSIDDDFSGAIEIEITGSAVGNSKIPVIIAYS